MDRVQSTQDKLEEMIHELKYKSKLLKIKHKEKNKQYRTDYERHVNTIKLFKIHLNWSPEKEERGNVAEEIFEENF